MRKGFTLVELLVVIAIIAILVGLLMGPDMWIIEGPFLLVCGWTMFSWRVLTTMSIDWANTGMALVAVLGLAIGGHLFFRWLHGHVAKDAAPWRPRWTAITLGLTVLAFAAGTSVVGMVHQTSWLVTSPEPLTTTRGGLRQLASRMNSSNNLKQVGLATHGYFTARKGELPPATLLDGNGAALHGWQTMLLPYVEQDVLYKQIDLKQPWHDAVNSKAFATKVKPYLYPLVNEDADVAGYALSHYAANVRVLGGSIPRTIKQIPDGTSRTILAGEAWANYHPWGRPGNWRDPPRGLRTSPDSFGNPRETDVTQFLMLDGSVLPIRNTVRPDVLKALATPDGGEAVDPNDW